MKAINLVAEQLPSIGLDITHQWTESVISEIGVLIVSPRGGRIKDKPANVSARVDHVAEKHEFALPMLVALAVVSGTARMVPWLSR